jgi:hypothetical protein
MQIKRNVSFGIDNPCTSDCVVCEKKTGVCSRQQTRFNLDTCDSLCDEDEKCIDGECIWMNTDNNWDSIENDNVCNPSCPLGTRCVNRQCEPDLIPYCPVSCRSGQSCVDGRCGCNKGELIIEDILFHFYLF